jgi:cell shape-determining protein MreC
VVDARGLLGQITRVQPLTAEVSLIIDKNQMVPVMIARTGERHSVWLWRRRGNPLFAAAC